MAQHKREERNEKTSFTLDELIAAEFPPITWHIDRILPSGVTLLFGASKVGKSILALQLLLAVSHGEKALGAFQCQKSGTLLISLEDGKRRVQERARRLVGPKQCTMYVEFKWERGQEGLKELGNYLDLHQDIRVVAIDTLGLFSRIYDTNKYSETTNFMEKVRNISEEKCVSIILIHHSKKPGAIPADDFADMALGSTGIVAGVDHLLSIQRRRTGRANGVLHFRSKDAESAELALQFSSKINGWKCIGEANGLDESEARQDILSLLRENGKMKTGKIAESLDKKNNAISNILRKLVSNGQVQKFDHGWYGLPT